MSTPKDKPEKKHGKYKDKLSINVDFHEAMKILADHANDASAKKTTYKNRRKASE